MRRGIAVVLPLIVVLAIILWRLRGPAPVAATAPSTQFSAERAQTQLRVLLAENVPHPIGSAANARVRDRVVARFRELGSPTQIQRRFACNAAALCANVENIIAGDLSRDAVVLAAHYDSVGAGPGASDDGSGVAALLEIASNLRGQNFRNPIAFLITDGEEAGLLGAEGFVADENLSKHASVVINVEYRGTSGPSVMFETSSGNGWLVRQFARSVAWPISSSLFPTIYDLLPNDTDLTVFKRAGRAGVNFGVIRNVVWYHTPLDDVAHTDARTLQHQGQNMLALARALANADLDARTSANAVFFDILGIRVLGWPAPWTLWIALVSLGVLVFAARKTNARAITIAVLIAFATIAVAALAGIAIGILAELRRGGQPWMAHAEWAIVAMWLTGIGAALIPWRGKTHPYGYAMVFHAAEVILGFTLPGPSYLFLIPAIALSLCAIANVKVLTASIVASVVAAMMFFPIATLLYAALGGIALPILAVLVALVVMLAAPAIANKRAAMIAFALAVVCAIVSLAMPAVTAERPMRLTLTYLDDGSQPMWIASQVTTAMRSAAPFKNAPADLAPWSPGSRYAAPAPRLALRRVELTRDGTTLHVRSHRDAQKVTVAFRTSAPLRGLRVNGIAPPPRPARFREGLAPGWHYVLVYGTAMDVALDVDPNAKIEAIASDVSYSLPREGDALARARNASNAVPSHEGDVTITRARLSP